MPESSTVREPRGYEPRTVVTRRNTGWIELRYVPLEPNPPLPRSTFLQVTDPNTGRIISSSYR